MEFPEVSAVKIVGALVRDNALVLAPCRGFYCDDDLVSEGVHAALKAWDRYDPNVAKPSTFIGMVAKRRLLDLAKMARPRRKYESRFLEIRPSVQSAPEISDAFAWDDSRTLHEWARDVYKAAGRAFAGGRYRQGRHRFRIAHVIAVAALKHRLKLSSRDLADRLKEDAELRHAVHIHLPPKYGWVWKAGQIAMKMGLFGEVQTEKDAISANFPSPRPSPLHAPAA